MINSKKYDVDSEAYKLYGEDLKSVLKRFRRTPDYLKILNDKMHDLKVYINEMSLQVLNYYNLKISQRVSDIIGITRKYTDETQTPSVGFHVSDGRRQDDDGTEAPDKAGIEALDYYKAFHNYLSVAERNSFRDIGFEFAGQIIHSIIHNMGPAVESTQKSTRLPFGGEDGKLFSTTVDHPHTHEVTPVSTVGIIDEGHTDEGTTETFRFRAYRS